MLPSWKKSCLTFFQSVYRRHFFIKILNAKKLEEAIFLAEDQAYIRKQLKKEGLAAFVADGSVLPRESGISSRPMKDSIPFRSPETLRITMELPHKGTITGMGIPGGHYPDRRRRISRQIHPPQCAGTWRL